MKFVQKQLPSLHMYMYIPTNITQNTYTVFRRIRRIRYVRSLFTRKMVTLAEQKQKAPHIAVAFTVRSVIIVVVLVVVLIVLVIVSSSSSTSSSSSYSRSRCSQQDNKKSDVFLHHSHLQTQK